MLNQAADLSACPAGTSRLLITTSMSNLKSPTIATITAIELHVQEFVGGAKDWINTMDNTDIHHVLTTQFTDSAWPNYTIR